MRRQWFSCSTKHFFNISLISLSFRYKFGKNYYKRLPQKIIFDTVIFQALTTKIIIYKTQKT